MKKCSVRKHLFWNNLKKNKMRNICAIIAIVLTSILFTTIFAVFYMSKDSFNEMSAKRNGWSAHAVVVSVTKEQYKSLEKSPLLQQISYCIHYGYVLDNNKNQGIELRYDQKKMLDWNFFNHNP